MEQNQVHVHTRAHTHIPLATDLKLFSGIPNYFNPKSQNYRGPTLKSFDWVFLSPNVTEYTEITK